MLAQLTKSRMRSPTHFTPLAAAWLAALALFVTSCNDDDHPNPYAYVGSACRDDRDCGFGAHCERGGDFPDGTCATACGDHRQCPLGSACVDVKGGLCLVACGSDAFCRPGYRCKAKNDRGDPGESRICIK